jgi:hypothetical protein
VWIAGADRGFTQTFYVHYKHGTETKKTEIIASPGSEKLIKYLVRDLEPLTDYSFQVWAVNTHGENGTTEIKKKTKSMIIHIRYFLQFP